MPCRLLFRYAAVCRYATARCYMRDASATFFRLRPPTNNNIEHRYTGSHHHEYQYYHDTTPPKMLPIYVVIPRQFHRQYARGYASACLLVAAYYAADTPLRYADAASAWR